jgi:2-keto-4-pentenoate hydratase
MVPFDQRIARGMATQLELRRERLAAGEQPLGWKVGFGAPAAMEKLGTERPLVGFLTDRGLARDGGRVAIGDWVAPVFEAEIAVQLAADVEPGASRDEVLAAVGGVGAAIELADVDTPPVDPEEILAGNIFHRHVILGPLDTARRDGAGIAARITRDGAEVARTDDPAALTGEIVEVVRLTAELLDACGERLRAGEVVITGSVVPPLAVAPGQRLEAELGPLGRLAVELVAD